MKICRANRAQAQACAAIYNYWVQHSTASFDVTGRDAAAVEAWYAVHEPAPYPLLAALDEHEVVIGWGTLTPWSPRTGYRHTAEISIFAHPGYLRRGVAVALGRALLGHARAQSMRTVLARLEAGNAPSLALFASLGFVAVGTMHAVGRKFERWLDVVLMECDLGEPEGQNPDLS